MSALSANQLYNISGVSKQGVTFKNWMSDEKALYQSKIDNGKITGKMAFPEWLNKRWASIAVMNADAKKTILKGDIGQAIKDIAKGVIKKTVTDPAGTVTDNSSFEPKSDLEVEKRILGMKPGVAYAVGGVILLGAIAGTIYLVQRTKKSA
jgi:hypothetical protein